MIAARNNLPDEIMQLSCDITVFLGKDEELTSEQIDRWKNYTKGNCTINYFNGGHFFINEKVREVVELINNTIHCNYKNLV